MKTPTRVPPQEVGDTHNKFNISITTTAILMVDSGTIACSPAGGWRWAAVPVQQGRGARGPEAAELPVLLSAQRPRVQHQDLRYVCTALLREYCCAHVYCRHQRVCTFSCAVQTLTFPASQPAPLLSSFHHTV